MGRKAQTDNDPDDPVCPFAGKKLSVTEKVYVHKGQKEHHGMIGKRAGKIQTQQAHQRSCHAAAGTGNAQNCPKQAAHTKFVHDVHKQQIPCGDAEF